MKNGNKRPWYWIPIAAVVITAVIAILKFTGSQTDKVIAATVSDTEVRLLAKKVPDHDKRIRVLEVEQAGMRANQKTIIKTIDSMDDKIDRLLSR